MLNHSVGVGASFTLRMLERIMHTCMYDLQGWYRETFSSLFRDGEGLFYLGVLLNTLLTTMKLVKGGT